MEYRHKFFKTYDEAAAFCENFPYKANIYYLGSFDTAALYYYEMKYLNLPLMIADDYPCMIAWME